MSGIMPPGMDDQQSQPAAPPAGPPDQQQDQGDRVGDEDGMDSNASPEEQKAYEDFVLKGFDLLYSGSKVRDGILKLLDDDPADLKKALGEHLPLDAPADPQQPDKGTVWDALKPVITLAAAGAIVTLEVLRSYPKGSVDGAVIMHGGKQLLEDLAQIAEKAGIHDYSEDELGEAFRRGADIFRDAAEADGLIDVNEAKQEWGEIVQADKSGQIDKVLPGISQIGGQQQQPPPGQQQQEEPPQGGQA